MDPNRLGARSIMAAATVTASMTTMSIGTAGIAHAAPDTRFEPGDVGFYETLEPGVDIATGTWLGTPVTVNDSCTLTRYRSYPGQFTVEDITEMPISVFGSPLTYVLTPGGSISLGGDCTWVLVAVSNGSR